MSSLLETPAVASLLDEHPRAVVVDAIRAAIDSARAAARPTNDWPAAIQSELAVATRGSLRPVINATGIILHTNLGRAPLAKAALDAIVSASRGFSNLEYDLESGRRGSRHSHCVSLLKRLTGAEDAMVVNNGAAALVLALNTLARKKEALVSRGELVEIGGSFRIPEIIERSGVKLVEVGTTNRTHPDDFRRAITKKTAAIVKIHRSNFAVAGFVSEVGVPDLVFIADEHGLPVIHDLGSGLMIPLDEYGLTGEPTVREAMAAKPTLAIMSGDKLLGGPQSGIILGDSKTIAKLRANPLARALRVDKMTIAALEATLRIYLDDERAVAEIPALAMIASTVESLRQRAAMIVGTTGAGVEIVESEASVGAGAFPTATIPSMAIALRGDARKLDKRLREGAVPVVGRISDDTLLLDLRSVPLQDDPDFAAALAEATR
ncbi:MAG: L-seryl-tRNA(Sec) selenium transferase [Gemmatimonadota bacterium]|nr:L-seryl-tRNA(Sec) selenium transferase [Gemmatimonadota bacterium]